MSTADPNINLIDSYFSMLKNLSPNNKLKLITLLSESMKTAEPSENTSWKSLFGALALDEPIDDFIADLKKDRTFSRKSFEL